MGLEPPRDCQHGKALDDIARLDAGLRAPIPARVDGPAARDYFKRSEVSEFKCAINSAAPPEPIGAAKSDRRIESWLTAP